MQPGNVNWLDAAAAKDALPCPACDSGQSKRAVLEMAFAPGLPATQLLLCPVCGTRYWSDLTSFDYQGQGDDSWTSSFYVEQGAAIDGLIEPIARLPVARIARCLEIGCGFGFSLDAGRRLYGWTTVGVDPSPLARAGRAALDLDIRPIYADADTDLGGLFDVVYGSEVIEHIARPGDFLAICRAHLHPGGILVLTTPDGDSIRDGVPMSALMPILSPGHHLVLFNATSLARAIRQAGFKHVLLVPRQYGLVVYASDERLEIDSERALDRALYRSYLETLLTQRDLPPALASGLRYRLFKEIVNAGEYESASMLYGEIAADCRARFGFGPAPPLSAEIEHRIRTHGASNDPGAPYCLPGLLFHRGMVTLNTAPDSGEAVAWFDEAGRAAAAFRAAYATAGVDDGETGMIEQHAPELAALALCHVDPDEAVARSHQLADPASLEALLIRLVDLGRLPQAAAIEPRLAENDDWKVVARRATLALLHAQEPARAADLFAAAFTGADGHTAGAEIWRLKYHELLARIVAADAIAAGQVAGAIQAAAGNVPAEIRAEVETLLDAHPGVRSAIPV